MSTAVSKERGAKEVLRPLVKWAGGKRTLWPAIRELVPRSFHSYAEPFLGGGAVFLGLASEDLLASKRTVLLNDSNEALVSLYEVVRDMPNLLLGRLEGYRNTKEGFHAARARNFREGDLVQRAMDFLVCNKTGFNGLYRVNRKGEFNVPHGRYGEEVLLADAVNVAAMSQLLRGASRMFEGAVVFTKRDFREMTDWGKVGEGWFVYADPPYVPLSATSDFTAYGADGFRDEEQVALRDLLLACKRRGAKIVASNSSAPRVWELYQSREFQVREVAVKRSINSKADRRGEVKEVLIT